MRRQIFRQMKQKAEWILAVFTSIFVKYESLFRIWRMQIASSDFLRDEGKNGENPLWIFEYFPEISRKICTQDACEKIRNRLWREICKQMACKVARRSLCGIAVDRRLWTRALIPQSPYCGSACKPQKSRTDSHAKISYFQTAPASAGNASSIISYFSGFV